MSNIQYHELRTEEAVSDSRRSSIEYIPQSRFTRTLLCLGFVFTAAITFIYMMPPMFTYSYENEALGFISGDYNESSTTESNEFVKSSKPQWTWVCEDDRCKRILAKENLNLQSLKTCNMLCTASPLWPMPTGQLALSKTIIPVEFESFTLKIVKSTSKEVTEYLKEAFELFQNDTQLVLSNKQYDDEEIGRELVVSVSVVGDDDPKLKLNTNERYKLVVKTEGDIIHANITAESFCGTRHGFETLSQLIWFDTTTKCLVTFEEVSIEDGPKFPYRGLLLDTARNYFPVEDILRTIDAMAASKLNTFHWHATDSQSFPLQLKSVPQLGILGAYSSKEVYTTEDVKEIVHRARVRGIRVLIEIDTPAHVGYAWSWGPTAGLGDLANCIEVDPWKGMCGEPPCGQLNPQNDHIYELLERIYAEILELTGIEDVFHFGGDEVNDNCWYSVFKKGDFDIMDAKLTFRQKARESLKRANKGKHPEMSILWSSRTTKPPFLKFFKNYTIQLWGGSKDAGMKSIPDDGFRSIMSHVDAWYLDCGLGSWRDDSEGPCHPYRKWTVVYKHRPWSDHPKWKVEGGEACLWTELADPGSLDSRLWPRTAAVGERLWSDPEDNTNDVYVRMDMQRQRYMERGAGAEPIWPRWCTENPYECL